MFLSLSICNYFIVYYYLLIQGFILSVRYGYFMSRKIKVKLIRDREDFLVVLPEDVVSDYNIKENDDFIILINNKNINLTKLI